MNTSLTIEQAQRDVRTTFAGGFAGQLVSGLLWLLSAALGTWSSPRAAIVALVVGGMFIFPLTQLTLRAMGGPAGLPQGHPMNALGVQVAFTLPLQLPLIYAATRYRLEWFYPAFMIALGAHYLPFIFLYGMPMFGALAAMLIGGGVIVALYPPGDFAVGAWLTAVILVIFAFIGRRIARNGA